jgi:ParB family chromosome partitioning protein
VRLAITEAPAVALRLMLAHAIGGGRWWSVAAEPRKAATDDIEAALAGLKSEAAFAKKQAKASKWLDRDAGGTPIVAHDVTGARTADVFARLLELSDAQVMQILAVVLAETLAAGTGLIDMLGQHLKVDCLEHWQPDVTAMLAEVIGEQAANSYLTEPGTKKKDIIRKALAGEGRSKVDGWTPRYMTFAQAQYTSRDLMATTRLAA